MLGLSFLVLLASSTREVCVERYPHRVPRSAKHYFHAFDDVFAQVGAERNVDPALLKSIAWCETRLDPCAVSATGAQGLMQVMTRVHSDKYEPFGGQLAAFDPVTNLRVGARVLQEYIQRDGSIEGGLRRYVGAAHLPNDGGYVAKVMGEHSRLSQVASGRAVPTHTPQPIPVSAPAKPAGEETLVLLNS